MSNLHIGEPLQELGEFLRARRAATHPADAGVTPSPGQRARRVRGLRREEVARLARMSVQWYTALEQGRGVRPSRAALQNVADALRLSYTERSYAFRLAFGDEHATADDRTSGSAPLWRAVDLLPTRRTPDGTPPSLRRLLEALATTPAVIVDRYWDVVGRNAGLERILPGLPPERTVGTDLPRNVVEYLLTSAAARRLTDWAYIAQLAVSALRTSLVPLLAADPADPRGQDLLATLERGSPEFPGWWAQRTVWTHTRLEVLRLVANGQRVEMECVLSDLRDFPGFSLIVYTPCDDLSARYLARAQGGDERKRGAAGL